MRKRRKKTKSISTVQSAEDDEDENKAKDLHLFHGENETEVFTI